MKIVNNLPGFDVDYKGVRWQKDFCGVEITVTNTGNKTVRVYDFNKMKTFDDNGNEYASRSFVGKNLATVGNGDFDFEPGVPVKCVYALFELPENGVTMSLLQLRTRTHEGANGYVERYIELRDVPIPARPTTTSTASGPFKGVWTLKGNGMEGQLNLDFYGKSIDGTDSEYNDIKCYGVIHIGYGQNVDDCSIIEWKADGNAATVTYIGGRDANTYQSVLEYNPANGSITINGTRVVKDEGMGDCYVSDGLVFKKK